MRLKLDYSWMGEKAISEIMKLDPTPKDYAISVMDLQNLGVSKYLSIKESAKKFIKIPQDKPAPYLLLGSGPEYMSMFKKDDCVSGMCFNVTSKAGVQLGSITFDGDWNILNTNMSWAKSNDIDIFKNLAQVKVVDNDPPSIFAFDNPFAVMMSGGAQLISGKTDDSTIQLKLPGYFINPDIEHITVIVDGVLYPSIDAGDAMVLPVETKTISIHVSDSSGNGTAYDFIRMDAGEDVLFYQQDGELNEKMEIFKQYLVRLIDNGYNIVPNMYPGGSSSIPPYEELVMEYGYNIFASPEMTDSKTIEINIVHPFDKPYTINIGKGYESTGKTIYGAMDWLAGGAAYLIVSDKSFTENKGYMKSAKEKYKAWKSGITKEALTISGDKYVPTLITLSDHEVSIPDELKDAEMKFAVRSDVGWGRNSFEAGGGTMPLVFDREPKELLAKPMHIHGELQCAVIKLKTLLKKMPAVVKKVGEASYEMTDKYGNHIYIGSVNKTIFSEEKVTSFLIIPKQSDSLEPVIVDVDLSAFGLGEIRGLAKTSKTSPVMKVGSVSQYDLYFKNTNLPESFNDMVNDIELLESDFGGEPGSYIKSIRFVEDTSINAYVNMFKPDEVNIIEGMLTAGSAFPKVGYHEAVHSIDLQLGISDDPEFKKLWSEIGKTFPVFFSWITEGNFIPDGFGGHPHDNEKELLATLLNSVSYPNKGAKDYMIGMVPDEYSEQYVECLEVVLQILLTKVKEGKLKAAIPVIKNLKVAIDALTDFEGVDPVNIW